MTRYLPWTRTILMLGSFAMLWGLNAGTALAQTDEDALFGLTKVHKFHLNLSATDYQKMQPPPGRKFPGFGPKQPGPKDPPKEAPDVHKSAGAFGTEFPFVGGICFDLHYRAVVLPGANLLAPQITRDVKHGSARLPPVFL